MYDITKFKKVNIYYYGNEAQKEDFVLNFAIPFFSNTLLHEGYYITRDWNGGPNVEVVYYDYNFEDKFIEEKVLEYCKDNNIAWTKEELQKNVEAYIKNMLDISKMEKKKSISIDINNNLKVLDLPLDMSYYRSVYNSSRHMITHFECRFLLEPLLEKVLKTRLSNKDLKFLVMAMYEIVMDLFEYGAENSFVMFYSNIAGVLAIAKQYGKEQKFKDYYEYLYKQYEVDKYYEYIQKNAVLLGMIEDFKEAYKKIYNKCEKLIDDDGLHEEGYYDLNKQIQDMKNNISGIPSEFHKSFLNDEKIDNIVLSKTHLLFRSITNIFYNCFSILNINFIEKNFCCYAIIKVIMKRYGKTWEQVFEEREIK